MFEPKIEEIDDCDSSVSNFVVGTSSNSMNICGGGVPICKHTNYEDIDEIIQIGCNGKLYSMKEIIDFDDEKFDLFHNQMLQCFNENMPENLKGSDNPFLGLIIVQLATTQTQAIFALQIVINRRENRKLERKLDLLLKPQ